LIAVEFPLPPFLVFNRASLYPFCPPMLLPEDPPPALVHALPVVPFPGQLLAVPNARPLPAPVAEDSDILTIPAPPHLDYPNGCSELRVQ